MRIVTPAKINLTLEVLQRRPDGFHELATWMVPIAVFDALEIDVQAGDDSFSSNIPELEADQNNLIFRAIARFRSATRIDVRYRVRLAKEIPLGAGLAGGSSDAAATLRLLSRIHPNTLSSAQLEKIGAEIGSDVVFFLNPRPAWCTGRGEKIEPREFSDRLWVCLFKPGFSVSTADAYSAYDKLQEKRGDAVTTPWGIFRNDLEPAVFLKFPLLAVIKEWLAKQPESICTLMSGSGSTVFAVTKTEIEGGALQRRFLSEFGGAFWTTVCQLNPRSEE
jgi:4-diphosphocytidyl-2-C-methyl-D-erythritol kinase